MQLSNNLQLQPQVEPVEIELSVVIPCLNEADSLAFCINTASSSITDFNISAEIIVADNGSTDRSVEIAQELGARVVHVHQKGYGHALIAGINSARGKYIIMGDADGSYDFQEIPNFLNKLREGYSLVQGCRLESGGGKVMPGAMPFLHRWVGNPFFSMMVRVLFNAPIHDVNCGMRGFSKALFDKLEQRCTGMEFAVEMVLKTSLHQEKIAEIPITLHPDRRIKGSPHLKTFRDGWRTLRFFLVCSPRWLFLYPGIALILLGILGYCLVFARINISGIGFDVHTLLLASLSIMLGIQTILFAISAKIFAITEGLLPADEKFSNMFKYFTLERGVIVGSISALSGLGLITVALNYWRTLHFGAIDNYQLTFRMVVPAVLLVAVGVQIIFSSFFLSILGMSRQSES